MFKSWKSINKVRMHTHAFQGVCNVAFTDLLMCYKLFRYVPLEKYSSFTSIYFFST